MFNCLHKFKRECTEVYIVYLSLNFNMNKKSTSSVPGLQGCSKRFCTFFLVVIGMRYAYDNWKHCKWLCVMSSHWWSWTCFKHESFYQAENMTASLLICTKEQQSSLVHFLWGKKVQRVLKCTHLYVLIMGTVLFPWWQVYAGVLERVENWQMHSAQDAQG